MNFTPKTDDFKETGGQFAELLDLIRIRADEPMVICTRNPGGPLEPKPTKCRGDTEQLVSSPRYVGREVFYSVNPIALPEGYAGRGTDEHVTRCAAMYADIDIKDGGVSGSEVANTVTQKIANALGEQPAAVVLTGHGGHPYWVLDPDDEHWTLDTPEKRAAAQACFRRFHRMCAHIAAGHGGSLDNVSQLSRILRVPGSSNWKNADRPILVELLAHPYGASAPLTYAAVIAALDAYGVPQLAEDTAPAGVVVSDPAGWEFGAQTTPYVHAMVSGWRSDIPSGGRHNWLVSQAIRLSCAHRLGRITEDDHDKAVLMLGQAFETLLATHGERRRPDPGEVEGALAWGVRRTASLTDEKAAQELGGGEVEASGARRERVNTAITNDGLPKLRRAKDMKPARSIEWLAKGNVPKSAVTLLVGDEGIGKSTFWVWLAAHVSTGTPCPDYGLPEREPCDVVLVVTEDDWSSAVRPRLEVAGANLERIHVFSAEDDGGGAPTFPDHLDILRAEELAPALIVVDAWLDTVPASLSVKDPQQARQVLHPWKEYATATEAAVLLLTHTNRVPTANAREKYGATGELRKTARQTLYALADPDADDCMIVGPEKSNNVARGVEAARFRIVPVKFKESNEDSDGIVTKMEYRGPAGRSIRELIAEAHRYIGDSGKDDKLNEAVCWLEDYLSQNTPSRTVKADAKTAGISERTLSRAAEKLHVISTTEGFPRTTHWALPGGVVMNAELVESVRSPAEDG